MLVEAVETDLEWLEDHARLLVRASKWERGGRDASFLLRGRDLSDAESWLTKHGSRREAATPLHVDYIVASRTAAARRQRAVLAGVSIALGVSLLLAVVAWIQRNDAIERSSLAVA